MHQALLVQLYLLGRPSIMKDSSQAKYARDLLERFHMTNYKSSPNPFLSGVKLEDVEDTPLVDSTLYKQLVGILLYLTHSRLDLSYVVGIVSRFM
jgi:hypothetical protein